MKTRLIGLLACAAAATAITAGTTTTAEAAPAAPAAPAVNPSVAGTLALVPVQYKGKGTLVVGDSSTDASTATCCAQLLKYKSATQLTVYDGHTSSLFRVDDYVLNLSQRTNFEGIYKYSPTNEPDPCPVTQNCALITSNNVGASGKRVSWSYYTVVVGGEDRIVSASANMNTYYPTDQHYADVEVCAGLSHVVGLNYTRGPTVARSCLDTEPYNGGTLTYWTGADWDYTNQLWNSAGKPA